MKSGKYTKKQKNIILKTNKCIFKVKREQDGLVYKFKERLIVSELIMRFSFQLVSMRLLGTSLHIVLKNKCMYI